MNSSVDQSSTDRCEDIRLTGKTGLKTEEQQLFPAAGRVSIRRQLLRFLMAAGGSAPQPRFTLTSSPSVRHQSLKVVSGGKKEAKKSRSTGVTPTAELRGGGMGCGHSKVSNARKTNPKIRPRSVHPSPYRPPEHVNAIMAGLLTSSQRRVIQVGQLHADLVSVNVKMPAKMPIWENCRPRRWRAERPPPPPPVEGGAAAPAPAGGGRRGRSRPRRWRAARPLPPPPVEGGAAAPAPAGNRMPAELDVCLEKQLERFEWQLKIFKQVLSANGNPERAELLKHHTDEEVCSLVLSILDKVKTETTADLNVLHEQNSKAAVEEHDRHVGELHRKHEQERNQLTETFQAAQNVLQGKVEVLTAELQLYNELQRRVRESTFKKDLQRNIQEHGSPGAFWESEQESLLFVIEMKTERVQEQSRKLQQMDELVEKNLSLEDQVIHVLQQNEDLKVRMDNCQTLIQQLSREQQDLKVALERQVAVNQKLSQEKEQLMFKLRHKDSCPSIHLPAMMQEIAPR
ncbi:coiled-coil domain-containing protein 69 [Xenentodon cancila]